MSRIFKQNKLCFVARTNGFALNKVEHEVKTEAQEDLITPIDAKERLQTSFQYSSNGM